MKWIIVIVLGIMIAAAADANSVINQPRQHRDSEPKREFCSITNVGAPLLRNDPRFVRLTNTGWGVHAVRKTPAFVGGADRSEVWVIQFCRPQP